MKILVYTFLLFLFLLQTTLTSFSQKLSAKQFPEKQMLQAGVWNDTDGNFINAHGGGILYHQGTYYWYGEIKRGKTWLVADEQNEYYRVKPSGISCYSSKDLKSWKFEKIAFTANGSDTQNEPDTGRVFERPKVLYNQKTKQFVMWMHMDNKNYTRTQAGVAVSSTPAGPYKFVGNVKPNENNSGDITVFKDDDGSGYLIYSSASDNSIVISLLSNDYCSVTNRYISILNEQKRTSPAMFKSGKKYYLITSAFTGLTPSSTSYAVADSPLGKWKQMGNPCIGPFSETTFSSQGSFVLPVNPKKGKFLFMADRWNKTDLENSRYLWLPMEVNGDIVNITWSAKVPD